MVLTALFGTKTIEKILLFLFVNGKCYGSQLQKHYQMNLTAIQNGIQRLEKGGIITASFIGKSKVFHLNPEYPLQNELEQLLKKAFTCLTPEEKRAYYLSSEKEFPKIRILSQFWKRLQQIKTLNYESLSKGHEELGWNGKGIGSVEVEKKGDSLLFHEKGTWRNKNGGNLNFSNVFRWNFDRINGFISLEHLRRGMNQPVFLFHLEPISSHSLASIDSHLCLQDCYMGHIHFDAEAIHLKWRIIGPKKNSEIHTIYS